MPDWLQRDWCSSFVLTLGHFLWQGMLIAGVLAVALRIVTSVAARYWLSLVALLLMAVCPMVTFGWLLQPETPVATNDAPPVARDVPAANSTSDDVPIADRSDAAPQDLKWPSREFQPVPIAEPPKREVDVAMPASAPISEDRWWQKFAPQLMATYLGGVALMLLRLVAGLWGGRRLRRRVQLIDDSALLAAMQRQATALGLKMLPMLAYCERVTVPTVVGVLKPMILLPIALTSGLSPEQIESVLAHELAHLRRYDHLVNLLQRVIESLLFFHPAMWWVSHRIRQEREHCCDDLVVACGAMPLDYAKSLLRVAELSRATKLRRSVAAVSLLATDGKPSNLRQRIARLLGESATPNLRLSPRVLATSGIVLLMGLAMLIQLGISNTEAEKVPDEPESKHAPLEFRIAVTDADRNAEGTAWFPIAEPLNPARPKSIIEVPVQEKLGESRRGLLWDTAEHALLSDGTWKVMKCDVVEAAHSTDDARRFDLQITLDTAGGALLQKLSKAHQHQKLAIVVDGIITSVPVLRAELGESIRITGDLSKQIAEQLAAAIRKPDRRKRTSSNFTASLPNNARIDFIGLAAMEEAPKAWWKPDGSPLTQVPKYDTGITSVGGQDVRRALFHVHGKLSATDIITLSGSTSRWDEVDASGTSFIRVDSAYAFPPDRKTGRLEVGVATQPQSPVRSLNAKGQRVAFIRRANASDPSKAIVEFGELKTIADHLSEDIVVLSVAAPPLRQPALVNGQRVMSAAKEAENKQLRQQTQISWHAPSVPKLMDLDLVLIDVDGNEHRYVAQEAKISDAHGAGDTHWGRTERSHRFDVPLTRVAGFEYRVRPYQHWVTFENVALNPGEQTDVKVQIESTRSQALPGNASPEAPPQVPPAAASTSDNGTDAKTKSEHEAEPREARPQAEPGNEKASVAPSNIGLLPDGREVELVAVAHASVVTKSGTQRKTSGWWKADGTAFEKEPFEKLQPLSVAEGKKHFREVVIRLATRPKELASPENAKRPAWNGDLWWGARQQIPSAISWDGSSNLLHHSIVGFEEEKPAAVSFYYTTAPSVVAGTIAPDGKITASESASEPLKAWLRDVKVATVEQVGKETVVKLNRWYSGILSSQIVVNAIALDGTIVTANTPSDPDRAVFKLLLEDVDAFQIVVRPMTHRVDCENVALLPGQKCEPRVIVTPLDECFTIKFRKDGETLGVLSETRPESFAETLKSFRSGLDSETGELIVTSHKPSAFEFAAGIVKQLKADGWKWPTITLTPLERAATDTRSQVQPGNASPEALPQVPAIAASTSDNGSGVKTKPEHEAEPRKARPQAEPGNEKIVIKGRVVDSGNKPVNGASVAWKTYSGLKGTVASDARGEFQIAVSPGEFDLGLVVRSSDESRMWCGVAEVSTRYREKRLGIERPLVAKLDDVISSRVTVVDEDGRPVAGAHVVVQDDLQQVESLVTKEGGAVNVRLPKSAQPRVTAFKSGSGYDYFSFDVRDENNKLVKNPPALPKKLVLVLNGAKKVRITAVDTQGKPIPDVAVYPWYVKKPGKGDTNFDSVSPFGQTTNASGVATFDWLPPDVEYGVTFWFRSENYGREGRLEVLAEDLEKDQRVTLLRNTELSGRVLRADGTPAAKAKITANATHPEAESGLNETMTDAEGRFSLKVAPEMSYLLHAQVDGEICYLKQLVLREGKPLRNLELKLARGTIVKGKVTRGASGQPVADESVRLVLAGGALPAEIAKLHKDEKLHARELDYWRWARTDDDGSYQFIAAPGEYTLGGPESSGPKRSYQLKITTQPEIVRDFVIADTRSQALPGNASPEAPPQVPSATAATSDNGSGAKMKPEHEAEPREARPQVESGNEKTVRVRLTHEATKQPARELSVVVSKRPLSTGGGPSSAVYDVGSRESQVTSNADGVVTVSLDRTHLRRIAVFPNWPNGDRNNVASVGRIIPRSDDSLNDDDYAVELPELRVVSGRVVQSNAQPAAKVSLVGYTRYRNVLWFINGQTEVDGSFRVFVPANRNGACQLWAVPDAYCPVGFNVARLKDDLGTITLKEGMKPRGRVVDVDGTPLAGIRVNAMLSDTQPGLDDKHTSAGDNGYRRSAVTLADGTFEFAPVDRGTYHVAFDDTQVGSRPRPIQGCLVTQSVVLDAGLQELKLPPAIEVRVRNIDSRGRPLPTTPFRISGRFSDEPTEPLYHSALCETREEGVRVARLPRGIHGLSFVPNEDPRRAFRLTKTPFPLARGSGDYGTTTNLVGQIEKVSLEQDQEIEITWYAAPRLVVRVVDESQVARAAHVTMSYVEPTGTQRYCDVDRREGATYSQSLLPDETITITAEDSTNGVERHGSQTVKLAEGEQREVILVIKPTASTTRSQALPGNASPEALPQVPSGAAAATGNGSGSKTKSEREAEPREARPQAEPGNERRREAEPREARSQAEPGNEKQDEPHRVVPRVEGKVLDTSRNNRQQLLVQVSVGTVDGLREGDVLHVLRPAKSPEERKSVAQIRLALVKPDFAVGVVVNEEKGTVIQKGDDVQAGARSERAPAETEKQLEAAQSELKSKITDLKRISAELAAVREANGDTSQLDMHVAMARVRVALLQLAVAEASNRLEPGSTSEEQLQKLKRETLVRWGPSKFGVQIGIERMALKDTFEVGEPVVFQHRVRNTQTVAQRVTLRHVSASKVSSVLHAAHRFVVSSVGPVTESFATTLDPGADKVIDGAMFQIDTKGMIPERCHVESYLRFVLNDAQVAAEQIDVRPPTWAQMPTDLNLAFDVVAAPSEAPATPPQTVVLQGGADIFWGSPLQGLQAGLRFTRALKHPQQVQHAENWMWKMNDTVQAEFLVRNVQPKATSITYRVTDDDKLVELDPSASSLTAYDSYSSLQPWRNKSSVSRTEGHSPTQRERTKVLQPGEMLAIATQEFQLLKRPAANDEDWRKLPKVNCILVEEDGIYQLKTRIGVRGVIASSLWLETGLARVWLRDAHPQREVVQPTANASNVGVAQGQLTLRYDMPGAEPQATFVIRSLDSRVEPMQRVIKSGTSSDIPLAAGRYAVSRAVTLKVGSQAAVIDCNRRVVEVAVGKMTAAEFVSSKSEKTMSAKGQWKSLRERAATGAFLTVHPIGKSQMDAQNPNAYIDYDAVRETLAATTCGPDGVFQIEPLPVGRYVVIARAFSSNGTAPGVVSMPYLVGAETFSINPHASDAYYYPNEFRLLGRWNIPLWSPSVDETHVARP